MHDGRERLLNAGGIVFRTIIERSVDSRCWLNRKMSSSCSCNCVLLFSMLLMLLLLLLWAVCELIVEDYYRAS